MAVKDQEPSIIPADAGASAFVSPHDPFVSNGSVEVPGSNVGKGVSTNREKRQFYQPEFKLSPDALKNIGEHITVYQRAVQSTIDQLVEEEAIPGWTDSGVHVPWLPEKVEVVRDPEMWDARQFTTREHEVAYYVYAGLSNSRIAGLLDIGDQTVKNHLTNVIRKTSTDDRDDACAVAVSDGSIEPSLIPIDYDYTPLATVTDRERHVYNISTDPERAWSNRELADRLFVTEQTAKSHMTALLAKLGFADRGEMRLFEQKRRDYIATKTNKDVIVELAQVAGTGETDYRKKYYEILNASSDLEAAAHGVWFGIFDRDQIATPQSFALVSKLTRDERKFLRRLGTMSDQTDLSDRWTKLDMSKDSFKDRLHEIRSKLGVSMDRDAVVLALVADCEDYAADLTYRTRRLEWLKATYGQPQTSETVMDKKPARKLKDQDPVIDSVVKVEPDIDPTSKRGIISGEFVLSPNDGENGASGAKLSQRQIIQKNGFFARRAYHKALSTQSKPAAEQADFPLKLYQQADDELNELIKSSPLSARERIAVVGLVTNNGNNELQIAAHALGRSSLNVKLMALRAIARLESDDPELYAVLKPYTRS